MLTPVALGFLVFLQTRGSISFGHEGWWLTTLLVITGVVTAIPLVWFGHAARHLRLTTLGFLQYLAPTFSFLLGVYVYGEPFTRGHLITFSLIWLALIIFTLEAVIRWRTKRAQEALAESLCEPV